jgi:hypothetical protein
MFVWSGSAWVSVATEVESLAGFATQSYADNTPGMKMVVPTSVAVGSGSGSVDTKGAVTFSGASSILLNNCFTSVYQNYQIICNITQSTGSALKYRVSSGGTPVTSSTYRRGGWYQEGPSTNGLYYSSSSETSIVVNDKINASIVINTFKPFEASATSVLFDLQMENGSVAGVVKGYGYNTNATSYDGFQLSPDSGTIAGTIRVYGYKN